MILPIMVFNASLVLACGYAAWRGGAPERAGALLLLIAAAGSAAITLDPATSFTAVELWIFGIDVALFIALVALTGIANRYWPMWLAAMQLVTVATHGIRAFDRGVWSLAYWSVSSYMAYLLILFLVIGTTRHRRRLIAGLPERAWLWPGRPGYDAGEANDGSSACGTKPILSVSSDAGR